MLLIKNQEDHLHLMFLVLDNFHLMVVDSLDPRTMNKLYKKNSHLFLRRKLHNLETKSLTIGPTNRPPTDDNEIWVTDLTKQEHTLKPRLMESYY